MFLLEKGVRVCVVHLPEEVVFSTRSYRYNSALAWLLINTAHTRALNCSAATKNLYSQFSVSGKDGAMTASTFRVTPSETHNS